MTTRPAPAGSAVTSSDSGRTSATTGARGGAAPATGRRVPSSSHLAVAQGRGQPVHRADELGDERGRRALVQLVGAGDLLQPPGAHHADPVGDRQRLGLVVGDEHGGDAELELDPADLLAQLHPHLGVQRRERLVEQQHLRRDRQRPGQRHPLLLAAGELVRVPVAAVGEADELQQLRGPAATARPCPAADPQPEGDVVGDA